MPAQNSFMNWSTYITTVPFVFITVVEARESQILGKDSHTVMGSGVVTTLPQLHIPKETNFDMS